MLGCKIAERFPQFGADDYMFYMYLIYMYGVVFQRAFGVVFQRACTSDMWCFSGI